MITRDEAKFIYQETWKVIEALQRQTELMSREYIKDKTDTSLTTARYFLAREEGAEKVYDVLTTVLPALLAGLGFTLDRGLASTINSDPHKE